MVPLVAIVVVPVVDVLPMVVLPLPVVLIVVVPVTAAPPDETVNVVRVGAVAKTSAPLPVSSESAVAIPDDSVVAVNADVPLPITTPVSVDAPVPPLATGSSVVQLSPPVPLFVSSDPEAPCEPGRISENVELRLEGGTRLMYWLLAGLKSLISCCVDGKVCA